MQKKVKKRFSLTDNTDFTDLICWDEEDLLAFFILTFFIF